MSSKIITYDLCAPGRKYDQLIDHIKTYSSWARVTESTWVIASNDSCVTIRDTLKTYIDSNDRLFVGELTGVAAWSNVRCDSDYLKNHI